MKLPNEEADVVVESTDARVTVALVQGNRLTGVLRQFLPTSPVLDLEVNQKDEESGEERLTPMQLETKDIIFVGFERKDESDDSIAPPEGARPLKIYTTGGKVFWVKTRLSLMKHPVGFFAFPLETHKSPFSHLYFFAHSVRQQENPEYLGALLKRDKRLTAEQLQQGLHLQTQQHSTRIGEVLVEQQRVSPSDVDQAVKAQKERRKRLRLGEVLVEAGLIDDGELQQALTVQKKKKGSRLGDLLVELGHITEDTLYFTLAEKFFLPYVNLEEYVIDWKAFREVKLEWLDTYNFLPLRSSDKVITIAISDPLNWKLVDLLRFKSNKEVQEVIVRPTQLAVFIEKAKKMCEGETVVVEKVLANQEVDFILSDIEDAIRAEQEAAKKYADDSEELNISNVVVMSPDDPPISRLANQVILDAYENNTSDIHIEPQGEEGPCRIRFRIDGKCEMYKELPAVIWRNLVTRYKVMSQLDIAERRIPQDGKIRVQLTDRMLELRVATIPTTNQNEDVVMRLLAASEPLPLDKMGFSERNNDELRRIIEIPYGLILCVGPTGSGKTTTLHSLLGYINRVDRKIWTAEDPVEITQRGLRQVQVNPRTGMTFAKAMRAFLRADPDVIMVGEMRDLETAETGVEASLTGHLVLSTLHTNSAPETVTRLLDLGLDPFSFADSLLGILAQRLARRLCSSCKKPYHPEEHEYEHLVNTYGAEDWERNKLPEYNDDFQLYQAPGCGACRGTGYKGRLGIHELLIGDNDETRKAIQQKASVAHVRSIAVERGMTTLMQDGIAKTVQGITDLKQVLAVCS